MKIRRLISMGIDMGIILIFEVFFYSLIGEALFKSTYVSVGVAYFIGITLLAFLQSRWGGRTIGKRIVKLKVVGDDEKDLSFLKYWIRLIVAYVLILFSAGVLLAVNVLLILVRKDQKTLQDFIVNTHIKKATA